MSDLQVPDFYSTLLFDLKMITGRDALIAGGCLRDLDNGRPVKDIDIFYCAHSVEESLEIYEAIRKAGLIPSGKKLTESNFYPEAGTVIMTVFDITTGEEEYPLQVIIVHQKLDQLFECFDFGMCMISFDGFEVKRDPRYVVEKAAKLFNCHIKSQRLLPRIKLRWERISVKYPDFDAAIPDIQDSEWRSRNDLDDLNYYAQSYCVHEKLKKAAIAS